jgi:bifunctional pyridoxal-dependent enzyme with beta-cystathionase and maltose regulon repressor activities
MTTHDDFNIQANALMYDLNDATSALMGMVGKHNPKGSIWTAAATRQSRSYLKWSTFIQQSAAYGTSLG